MNVKLLRKVIKHIVAEPLRFDMGVFHAVLDDDGDWTAPVSFAEDDEPPCGTVGCIAGWAVGLAGRRPSRPNFKEMAFADEWRGAEVLGLDGEQAKRLFFVGNWPENFREEYSQAENDCDIREAVEIAVRRIEHFIETDGAE